MLKHCCALAVLFCLSLSCAEPTLQDGLQSKELIGGLDAEPGQFPSTVRFQFQDKFFAVVGSTCTAAKIGPRHFLLAAHCVWAKDLHFASITHTGAMKGDFWKKLSLPRKIHSYHVHPSYAELCGESCTERLNEVYYSGGAADLAVLILTEDTPEIPVVQLDPLPVEQDEELILQGYGCEDDVINQGGRTVLKSALTTVARPDTPYFSTVGPANDPEAAGICPGDSGGPVYRQTDHGLTVVGVNAYFTYYQDKPLPTANMHTAVADQGAYDAYTWLSLVLDGDSEPDGTGEGARLCALYSDQPATASMLPLATLVGLLWLTRRKW